MTAALRHFVVVRPTKAVFAPATLLRTVVGSDVPRPTSTCAAPHVPRRAQRPRAPRPAPRRAQRPRSSVAELLLALYAAFATCCVVSDTTPLLALVHSVRYGRTTPFALAPDACVACLLRRGTGSSACLCTRSRWGIAAQSACRCALAFFCVQRVDSAHRCTARAA